MKILIPFLFLMIAFNSCTQVGKKIDEAREARKKRDSILKAFKEVNDQLDSLSKTYESRDKAYRESIDSIYKKLNDTLLSR